MNSVCDIYGITYLCLLTIVPSSIVPEISGSCPEEFSALVFTSLFNMTKGHVIRGRKPVAPILTWMQIRHFDQYPFFVFIIFSNRSNLP